MPCTWRHQGQEVTFLLQELCSSSWTANFSTTFLKIPLLEHLFCFCCSPDHWLWANPKINKATLTKRASETSSPLIQGSLLHREICPKPIRMEKYFPPMGAYVPAIHQSSWEVHLNTFARLTQSPFTWQPTYDYYAEKDGEKWILSSYCLDLEILCNCFGPE